MVMTPLLVTVSIACATISPTSSLDAEIAATLAICSRPLIGSDISAMVSTALSVAFFIPFLRMIGLQPAAMFFTPSLIIA